MEARLKWVVFILFIATIVWIVRRSRRPLGAIVNRDQSNAGPYPYVYVNADGTARELHPGERNFLETPFHPADGGRPYVKDSYSQKNGWGEVAGFLRRSKLPLGTPIFAAPEENPCKPATKEDQIQFLRAKGMEVTENSNRSFTVRRPNR